MRIRADLPPRRSPAEPVGRAALAILGLIAVCAVPAAAQSTPSRQGSAPTDPLQSLGPGFSRTETPRFLIVSNDEPADTIAVRVHAEKTFDHILQFARRLRLPIREPAGRLVVVAFSKWADYEAFARSAGFSVDPVVPGFFDERSNRCYVCNVADSELIRRGRDQFVRERDDYKKLYTANPQGEDTLQRAELLNIMQQELLRLEGQLSTTVTRHEIAHLVLFNLGLQSASGHRRRWLKEGLAMQFESDAPANPYRLSDYLAIDWSKSALTPQRLVSDPTVIGPGGPAAQEAYAAAWALVWFLIKDRPGAFAEYLQPARRSAGDSPAADLSEFEASFGKLDAAFLRRWRAAMEDLREKPALTPGQPERP